MAVQLKYTDYFPNRPLIDAPPLPTLEMAVVIPCFAELQLMNTLRSLSQTSHFDQFEVIVLINQGINATADQLAINQSAFDEVIEAQAAGQINELQLHVIWVKDIDSKNAGVGTARKLGMDEAVKRFQSLKKDGILTCLDADCTVATNYAESIIQYFSEHAELDAVSIHYEHDVEGENAAAITDYELHLRIHIEWQKWLGLPFAFQTVGSSMAVRSEAYVQQGGMNRRKAGEDFYFLHKYSAIERLGELYATTVYPSARPSDRVPFGTGRAILQIGEGKQQKTYAPQSYLALQPIVDSLADIHARQLDLDDLDLPAACKAFFQLNDWQKNLEDVRKNTTSYAAFEKRFYRYFNAFRLMKYLHYMRDHEYADVEMVEAASELYRHRSWKFNQNDWQAKDYLLDMRKRAKN